MSAKIVAFYVVFCLWFRNCKFQHSDVACASYAIITEDNGSISSPNYPDDYNNNLNCNWTIVAPPEKLIEMKFIDFQLETCYDNLADSVTIYDGDEQYTGAPFCGTNKPIDFESSTSRVIVLFTSDVSITTKGFLIQWIFKDRCQADQYRCWNGLCIPASQQCNGVNNCADDSDEIECARPSSNSNECGKQDIKPEFTWSPRIIGGNKAVNGSWPWQAMLVDASDKRSFCGGSIIDERFVLTAAHCVQNIFGPASLIVYLGRHSYKDYDEGESFVVESITMHPAYDEYNLQNDIALLKLQDAISFTTNMKKVCYPTSNDTSIDPSAGKTCIVTGWGNISPAEGSFVAPETLYQARVPIVDLDRCRDLYSSSHQVIESQVCAGFVDVGSVDTCQGDSGGPLVCLIDESTWYQIGITSFGIGCAQPGYPGVYTRLSSFAQWIEEVVSLNGSQVDGAGNGEPACVQPTIITEENGTISSPNFPSDYLDDLNCTWIIQAPLNKLIVIRFLDFQLEGCSHTVHDFLAIYDGNELLTGVRFCGGNKPKNFESSTNHVRIHLYTDSYVTDKGFHLNWRFKDDCSSNEFRCWNGSCIAREKKCDRIRHCEDDSDEIECAQTYATLEECGKQNFAPHFTTSQRIIGGEEAINGSWPWQASLVNIIDGSNLCGGSIVHERFILTAAHCFTDSTGSSDIGVYVGRHSYQSQSEGKLFLLKNIIRHPAYDYNNLQNDIALLELEDAISFATNIGKICYPPANHSWIDPDADTTCIITGWGNIFPSSGLFTAPEALYQARVPIVDLTECTDLYSPETQIKVSQICAGFVEGGGVDTCQGDSGGPLVCLVGENTWYQVGITSFGIGCAQPGYPGVYTRLSYFTQWIEEVIASNGSYVGGGGSVDAACLGGTILTQGHGTLSSPNYPDFYDNDLSCTWTIQAPSNMSIEIQFTDFELESCNFNVFDYLVIYDGGIQYTGVRFCGTFKPNDFESTSNQVRIQFYSDGGLQTKGFLLNWQFVDACSSNEFRCWNGSCISGTQHCDGIRHCFDDSDEIECAQDSSALEECGKQDISPHFTWNPRIIGGNEAAKGSWPWLAMLVDAVFEISFCGGSIIDERFILTAAHCVEATRISDILVYVGRHNYDDGGELHDVASITIHPDYNSSSLENDIALIKVHGDIIYTSEARPICYSSASQSSTTDPPAGTTCVIMGWGNISPTLNFISPHSLHQARVPIVDTDVCANLYSGFGFVDESHVCAGFVSQGGVDSCQGDSGGPLICLVDEKTWYQIGITSFGNGCALPNYPGVYTRVSFFSNWIDEVILSKSEIPSTSTATPTTASPGDSSTISTGSSSTTDITTYNRLLCYQCDGRASERNNCSDENFDGTHLKYCPLGSEYCKITTAYTISPREALWVIRSCSDTFEEKYCYFQEQAEICTELCSTDGCNGSRRVASARAALLLLLGFVFAIFLSLY
ncbi:transmembrane protease serine 9-like [Clavelina lepadiformis]|uniref:transmembrane protease serine 9-like n=1 Tax=Clavelina lepadiformis TaxID=159417 RepID=UPI0040429499